MPALRAAHSLKINPDNLSWTDRKPAGRANCIQRGENFLPVDFVSLHSGGSPRFKVEMLAQFLGEYKAKQDTNT